MGFGRSPDGGGDWNGDGRTKIGVYNPGFWSLDFDGSYVWDGGTTDKIVG